MTGVKSLLGRVARTGPVRRIRRYSGRFGAPGLNPELDLVNARLAALETVAGSLQTSDRATQSALQSLADIERHMPAVLNAIASTNGTARLLRRELDARLSALDADVGKRFDGVGHEIERIDQTTNRLDGHVQNELWPLMARSAGLEGLYATSEWLTKRVEVVRAEFLNEIRYGSNSTDRVEAISVDVVNPAALESDTPLRLNLGCGHIPLDGYVNVDMRNLPGVDVVAPVEALPFEPGTVGEIYSAHVLEHFPKAELVRRLLPYWRSLLIPGGEFRCIVPDVAAMIEQFNAGTIDWENLRLVVYGGQEYEGDFHHTAFTPDSMSELLVEAGFVDPEVVDRGRVNVDCLEFEVTARRPV